MTRDEIKRWWFDLFGAKFKNSATYRAVEERLDQICDAHEAELKAKDERIVELEARIQNMCAECECAKFADNAIKPYLALKDNK